MSRSPWAWARSCGLVDVAVLGVGRLGKREVRENLEAEPPVHTLHSLAALTWVATVVTLMLALSPALALGKSASRSGRAPATRAAVKAPRGPATRTEHGSLSSGSGARSRTAGPQLLALGSGYADTHGARAVRTLQRRLANLGYSPGPIDGRFGPLTERAVIAFQATHGLIADGIVGPRTTAALASAKLVLRPGDGYVLGGSGPVRALQRHLAAAGFPAGAIDGRFGPMTERAVIRFQTARHLHVDGIAGPQTLGRLQRSSRHTARPRTHAGTLPSPKPHPTKPQPTKPHPAKPHPTGRPQPAPRTPTTATPAPNTGHHVRGTSRPSPFPWLVVVAALAVVALGMLTGLLWYRHRRRTGRAQTAPGAQPGASEAAPEAPAVEVDDAGQDHRPPPLRPPEGAPAFKLARLLAEAGNVAGAADAFRRADERGHPTAAFELGALLLDAGDLTGAEDAFRRADERGDPGGACNLGVLLEQRGDIAAARLAYERADERGHAVGAWNLGSLLEQQGDREGAQAAYERAAQRGEAGAAFDLGLLLERAGEPNDAMLAYRRADQAGHSAAALHLGLLLAGAGDLAGAEEAFARADERGDPDGACNLGLLLEQRGDLAAAKAAYQRADARGHPVGAWNLGSILEHEGDRAGAKAAYERAEQRGYAAGACNLGLMLEQEGDRDGAVQAFERASQAGPPDVAEMAYAALRELRDAESPER